MWNWRGRTLAIALAAGFMWMQLAGGLAEEFDLSPLSEPAGAEQGSVPMPPLPQGGFPDVFAVPPQPDELPQPEGEPVSPRFPEENTLGYFGIFGLVDVLGNGSYDRSRVRSVRFEDSLADAPEDAWDVSHTQNNAVLAWMEPNGDLYDLVIAGEGGVRLNEDSGYLFRDFDHLESVQFGDCASLLRVERLDGMFQGCASLKELDLPRCTDACTLERMFEGCASLTELDFGEIAYTDNVMSFANMFSGCASLERIEVGDSFIVLQGQSDEEGGTVEPDTSGMFDGCGATILWRNEELTSGEWLRRVTVRPGIRFGDTGDGVRWLQGILIHYGFLPEGADDGIFGEATEAAVKNYMAHDHVYLSETAEGFLRTEDVEPLAEGEDVVVDERMLHRLAHAPILVSREEWADAE